LVEETKGHAMIGASVQSDDPSARRYSYSSTKMGVKNRANELIQLFRISRVDPAGKVAFTLQTFRNTVQRIEELAGVTVENLKVLDIGPGQQLRHMRCFSQKNDVVGIDLDVIPQGLQVVDYLRMLRHSPLTRTMKTLARKALGSDARFTAALARELGVKDFPQLPVLRMSATRMTFPDATFGLVCSYSVFEHIDDPAAALKEVRRVLKPGGVAYISVHIYTSHSGAHDPDIMASGRPVAPLWPHLRPQFESTVNPSTYLNRLSLADWRLMFQEIMPGVQFVNERQDSEIGDGLKELRERGELAQYTDEELMTVNFVAVWKKS
jgi:SAM-dependent methyltransferase